MSRSPRLTDIVKMTSAMRSLPTKLTGPVLLAPTVHGDERGFFLESYRASAFAELGVEVGPVAFGRASLLVP